MSVELEVVSKFCFLFLLVALAECLRANGMVWQKPATLSPQSDEREKDKKILTFAKASSACDRITHHDPWIISDDPANPARKGTKNGVRK